MKRLLILVLWMVSLSAGADDVPYEERVEMLNELGLMFPGAYDNGYHDYTLFGMWAGIAFQSHWQMRGHGKLKRAEIPIWEKVNRALTVVPFIYAKEWREEGKVNCSERTDSGQSIDMESRRRVCAGWMNFFTASDTSLDEKWIQSLMWKAHELAIRTILSDLKHQFTQAEVPDLEYWFWKGWTNSVRYIAKKNLASNTDFSDYAGRLPVCILGRKGCQIDDLPKVQQGHTCLHIRLALEENPEWVEKISTWIALRLPIFILERFYSNPKHCKVAKKLLATNPQRY